MRRLNQLLCQFLLVLVTVFFAACSKRYSELPAYWPVPFREYHNQSVGRFKSSYLAEQIDAYYRGSDPGPIGVTTLVNLDDLYTTSTFGRMYSEQLISELAMKGYEVVELRASDALRFMNDAGEFGLSRDAGAVRDARNLGAILVGTYSVSPQRVYVNVRLIDPKSSIVLSAGSVEMDKTHEIGRLLKGGAFTTTMERIPVKHMDYTTYPAMLFPGYQRHYDLEEMSSPPPQAPVIENKVQPKLTK